MNPPRPLFTVESIDPARDARAIVREVLTRAASRLGAALGQELTPTDADVDRSPLLADLELVATIARHGTLPLGPAGADVLGSALTRCLAAVETPTDSSGMPTTKAGFILRVARARLALATGEGVSSADLALLAGVTPGRVRQIALERDPTASPGRARGAKQLYTAASARKFLESRGVRV